MEERKKLDYRYADPNYRPPAVRIVGAVVLLLLILIGLSIYYHWFIVLVFGDFVMGCAIFVLFFKSAGVNIQRRFLLPVSALVFLGFSIYYAQDLPAAFRHQALVAEGVPTKTEAAHRAKGGGIYGTYVTIQNHKFLIDGYTPDQIYDRYIIIHYYPHTGYQAKAEVLSYVETWKKTGKLK